MKSNGNVTPTIDCDHKYTPPARASLLFAHMLLAAFVGLGYKPVAYSAEFKFKTKGDQFTVMVTEQGAQFEGQPVDIEPFTFIHPLFKAEMSEDCPKLPARPDLTISRNIENKVETRKVYITQEIVTDGSRCRLVGGHGLYKLPLHRDWFSGKKTGSILLKDSFSVIKNGRTIVSFKQQGDKWISQDPSFFTNWQFVEQFVTALKNFEVDFRVHTAAQREKTKFELVHDKKTYAFYLVGEKTWAVQMPGAKWLDASRTLGFFADMEPTVWLSPDAKLLKMVTDKSAKVGLRLKAARTLSRQLGPDSKPVFLTVIKTDGDDVALRKELIEALRKQPTDENFSLLLEALQSTQEVAVQTALSKALRVRHPQGPIIEDDDSQTAAMKKVEVWVAWGKSQNLI